MKTKAQTITKLEISDKQEVYPKKSPLDYKVLLWIVNSDGSILLKRQSPSVEISELCSMTINTNALEEALFKLENDAGILCHSENVRKIYEYSSMESDILFDVFFLTVNLDEEQMEIVEDRFNGKFIYFRDIMNNLSTNSISNECKEALINLLDVLSEKYKYL
jgi:hypothetical protein